MDITYLNYQQNVSLSWKEVKLDIFSLCVVVEPCLTPLNSSCLVLSVVSTPVLQQTFPPPCVDPHLVCHLQVYVTICLLWELPQIALNGEL